MVNIRCHRLYLAALVLGLVASASTQDNGFAPRKTDTVVLSGSKIYQNWLNEDVRYIINDQERADFLALRTDKQRDKFVEDFWARRNPTPESTENPYKEEHYRRLAYTNQRFAYSGTAGWKSDRGRFYIMYGKPDWIDARSEFTPPTETWNYVFIEGIGRNVVLMFTDKCLCGRYELSSASADGRERPVIFDPVRP